MRISKVARLVLGLTVLGAFAFTQNEAGAVSSFSRLYNMGCKGCHFTTPRLNYFGEKLLLRGYELDRMTPEDTPPEPYAG